MSSGAELASQRLAGGRSRTWRACRSRVEGDCPCGRPYVGPPGSMPRQEVGKARRVFDRTSDADPLS